MNKVPLLDQIKAILELLKEAGEDISEWIDYAEENELPVDTDDSYRISAEINSIIHEIDF